MSFWGGFVEGFATTAKEEIDKDVARTNQIVDDTVKIGVSKALETQEEIKKDKKIIRDELEMLTTQGFSLPKAASIVKAGMTSKMITLRNNPKNRLGADQLWDGTTKFAQDNKLTVQDVVNKLSYQEPLDYGNLNVATPKGSLLGALGLAPEVDTRVQEGIMSRVGKLDTGVDRGDISILPGSIPLEAKKQFDTDKTVLSLSQRASQLIQKQYTPEGLNETEQAELDDITVRLNPKAEKLLNIYGKEGLGKLGLAKPDVSPKELQDLYTKSQGESKEAMEAKETLKSEIDRIRKKYGKDYSNSLILGFK